MPILHHRANTAAHTVAGLALTAGGAMVEYGGCPEASRPMIAITENQLFINIFM